MISHMTYADMPTKAGEWIIYDPKNYTTLDKKYLFSQYIMRLSSPTLELCQDFLDNFEKYDIQIRETLDTPHYLYCWTVIHPTKENSLSFQVKTSMNVCFSGLRLGWFTISPPNWMNGSERSELEYVTALVMRKMKEKEEQETKKSEQLSRKIAIEVLNEWRKETK